MKILKVDTNYSLNSTFVYMVICFNIKERNLSLLCLYSGHFLSYMGKIAPLY